MKTKNKVIIIIIILLSMIMLMSCINHQSLLNEKKVFQVDDYNFKLSFPNNWTKVDKKTPYDLQCTNGKSYASIFLYYKSDLGEEQTPLDIYNFHKNDVLNKRKNAKIISKEIVTEIENKKVRSVLYSAEKDSFKNYYYFNLIEFKEADADIFAFIIFNAIPSYFENNTDLWKTIISSAEWVKK